MNSEKRKRSGRRGGGYAAFVIAIAVACASMLVPVDAVSQCGPGGCPGGSFSGGGFSGGIRGGVPSSPYAIQPRQPRQSNGSSTMSPVQADGKYASVVNVFVKYERQRSSGNRKMSGQRGSGVIVSWRGLPVLLTAAHVVTADEGVAEITATTDGGDNGERGERSEGGNRIPVSVLAIDKTWDVAICSIGIERGSIPLAEIEQGDAVIQQPGNELEAVGWGGEGPLAASRGRFERYDSATGQQATDWMRLSGIARSGDSGGPIFNAAGRVVGILWGTSDSDRVIVGAQGGRILTFLTQNDAVIQQKCRFFNRRPMSPVLPGPSEPSTPAPVTPPPPVEVPDVAPPIPVPVSPPEFVPEPETVTKPQGIHPAWIAAGPSAIVILFVTAMLTFAIAHSWHVTSGAGVSPKRRG